MKKLSLFVVIVALAFGIATPVSAQHCNVQKHDSMWKIAKRYNVSFKDVLHLNKDIHINPHLIHPGDRVELPDGSTGTTTNQQSFNEGNETATNHGQTTQAQQVLDLVNQERAKQGLNALKLDDNLTNIATMKAKDMADKGYFSHTSPTYGSPFQMLQSYGVKYSSAGENIAGGQKTASEVMQSWMNSSGHRANILNANYTSLGVGYVTGGSYGTYWVQLFTNP